MTVSETTDPIRITDVCGSLNANGATKKALAIALQGAAEYDVETSCRSLHCWVLPQEVSIANSAHAFDNDGSVKDPALEERLLNIGQQLVKFALVRRRIQQNEFMKLWKSLPTW